MRFSGRKTALTACVAAAAAACSGNSPPEIVGLSTVNTAPNEVIEIEVLASDKDGDAITLTMEDGAPRGSTFNQASGVPIGKFRWSPDSAQVGEHAVTFKATDGKGGEDTETVTIVVAGAGAGAPEFISTNRLTLDTESGEKVFKHTVEVKDDKPGVLMEAKSKPDGSRFTAPGGEKAFFVWEPTEAQKQTRQHTLVVEAADADQNISTQTIFLIIRGGSATAGGCTGTKPSVAAPAIPNQAGPDDYFVSATLTDAESQVQSATLHYAVGDEPGDEDFTSSAMQHGSGSAWSGTIPNLGLEVGASDRVTWFVCALDDDDTSAGGACDKSNCSPKQSFTASAGKRYCDPCQYADDCGGTSLCILTFTDQNAQCGADCTAASCAVGQKCLEVWNDAATKMLCVPEVCGNGAVECALCPGDLDPAPVCTTGQGCVQVTYVKEKFCGKDCTAGGSVCARGSSCYPGLNQCLPSACINDVLDPACSCAVSLPEAAVAGDLVINEVLFRPKVGSVVQDVNGDGALNSSEAAEEFVEILNVKARKTVDLGNIEIWDNTQKKFTFPQGVALLPGKAAVVFGGGDPRKFGAMGAALKFAGTGTGLGLDNTSDKVILKLGTTVLAEVSYTGSSTAEDSLVRQTEGDGAAAFIAHRTAPNSAGVRWSPGTQVCGAIFPLATNVCGGAAQCTVHDQDQEPNNDRASAACISAIPGEAGGTLSFDPLLPADGNDLLDVYSFHGTAGLAVMITTSAGAAAPEVGDTVVRLLDAGGGELASNDDASDADFYGTIDSFTLPAAGTYYVEVRVSTNGQQKREGSYTLSIDQAE